uniref:COX6C domain-containing protein n=1 Tax=Rhabditophanes sp. KR3021 TaxID=114890 RepID=A0AC35UCE4_9BILA
MLSQNLLRKVKANLVSVGLISAIVGTCYCVYEASVFVKRVSQNQGHNYHEEMEDFLWAKELEARKKIQKDIN